jgi:Uma2 family endonuclease
MFRKFQKYLEAGVREYWVINPETQVVQVHIIENGHYISAIYKNDDLIPVSVLPGFSIDLKTLWSVLK